MLLFSSSSKYRFRVLTRIGSYLRFTDAPFHQCWHRSYSVLAPKSLDGAQPWEARPSAAWLRMIALRASRLVVAVPMLGATFWLLGTNPVDRFCRILRRLTGAGTLSESQSCGRADSQPCPQSPQVSHGGFAVKLRQRARSWTFPYACSLPRYPCDLPSHTSAAPLLQLRGRKWPAERHSI